MHPLSRVYTFVHNIIYTLATKHGIPLNLYRTPYNWITATATNQGITAQELQLRKSPPLYPFLEICNSFIENQDTSRKNKKKFFQVMGPSCTFSPKKILGDSRYDTIYNSHSKEVHYDPILVASIRLPF